MRKGVYMYEYMNSWERFDEQQLHSKEAFYRKLNNSGISTDGYDHAKKNMANF